MQYIFSLDLFQISIDDPFQYSKASSYAVLVLVKNVYLKNRA